MSRTSSMNFHGGSPLNRLSWLRTSPPFLNAVARSSSTRWILYKAGQPLLALHPETNQRSLARLSTSDVQPLLGSEPYLGQGRVDGDSATGVPAMESARLRGPPMVFLGLEEPERSGSVLPSADFSTKTESPAVIAQRLPGTPYFSLDVSTIHNDAVDNVLKESQSTRDGFELSFTEPRAAMATVNTFDAAVFALTRSIIDWNARNKFCAGCGSPVYSVWAGWKVACSSLLPWADNTGKEPCPTSKGIQNYSHPRTDPVVIILTLNETGSKILLGRNKNFPPKLYSALAGFMEPGESYEDTIVREMWEEAGISVWDMKYHSAQPWPFPANVMSGFYARASETQPIRVDLDNELADARWFTREEVLAILAPEATTQKLGESIDTIRAFDKIEGSTEQEVKAQDDVPFKIPPLTAIAGVLIRDWAYGKHPHLTSNST